jgi:hypothetical protein
MSTISPHSRRDAGCLWAITSYFNPAGFRRKLANYRLFRERLIVPLVTVELAYGPNFELKEGDADILVQIRGRDVMWQKERLLNLALQALPNDCKNVVAVDCDIIFGTDDWPERVNRVLQQSVILQPYSHVHDLPRDWVSDERPPAGAPSRESVTSAIGSGMSASTCVGEFARNGIFTYSRGFAWAARRELLNQYGFYDARILGGGDRAFAGAVYGYFDAMRHNRDRRYLEWAVPFHEAVGNAVGWMNGDIYHLWHGEMRNRNYHERMKILERFEFDSTEDIAVAENGCWRWNTDKPRLHEYVRSYFASRREDG